MYKEKEIEKMAESICGNASIIGKRCNECESKNECDNIWFARAFFSTGYGDKKQAVKEFVVMALREIHLHLDNEADYTPSMTCEDIFNKLIKGLYGEDL